ncbi:MAG: cyclic nucleotide-binding domain-containing protein [Stagnimonas sp.]|nr:cyclic nucleotide-binding domain-containing protein [Stagnimonas sp.]
MSEAVSPNLFASLVPLNALKAESQATLAKKATLIDAPLGQTLFRIGEEAAAALFVLQGAVQLEDAQGKVLAIVRAGEPGAAHRLAHQAPRKVSAKVIEAARILAVDASLLDVMLTWDQTGAFEVDELSADDDTSGDWMARLLQMPTFQAVPPANLQAMFMRMEQVNYEAGHVVVKQGDVGDYFYVVMEGRCVVTREVPNQKPVRLAELEAGSCFGEEALISESPRNATVTLLTYGKLTRLAKADFRSLLNEPLARKISFAEAKRQIDSGQAKWLDVRMPSEVLASLLPGAINIPLFMLRMKLSLLDPNMRYIVVCDSGRRSSVAVFVLSQKGYDVSMLDGGIPK